MAKPSDDEIAKWEQRKASIIGLGERSARKSYYPQLRQNMERLQRFHTLLNHTSDFVVLIDMPAGVITDANLALAQWLNCSVEQLVGQHFSELEFCNDCQHIFAVLHRDMVVGRNMPKTPHHFLISQGGKLHPDAWLELSFNIARVDRHSYGVLVGRDITERKRNEALMNKLLSEKAALLDTALLGIASVRDRIFESCNRKFEQMLGYEPNALNGQSTRIIYQQDDTFRALGRNAYRAMKDGQRYSAQVMLTRADGSEFLCELTGKANNPQRPEDGSIWMFSDVNDLKLAEEKALFLTLHDSLTKLPNYQLLKDRLLQAISLAEHEHHKVALLLIDIDRFKTINDSLGYGVGNELLVQAAERIKAVASHVDTVSRQGGDEFILLLPSVNHPDVCVRVVNQLMAQLAAPYVIAETELRLSVSIGIALCPDDGSDFDTLLKKWIWRCTALNRKAVTLIASLMRR